MLSLSLTRFGRYYQQHAWKEYLIEFSHFLFLKCSINLKENLFLIVKLSLLKLVNRKDSSYQEKNTFIQCRVSLPTELKIFQCNQWKHSPKLNFLHVLHKNFLFFHCFSWMLQCFAWKTRHQMGNYMKEEGLATFWHWWSIVWCHLYIKIVDTIYDAKYLKGAKKYFFVTLKERTQFNI